MLGAARSRRSWDADWVADRGSAPAGVGQTKLCLPVCRLVCLSAPPGQRNRAEPQGKRASLTCSRLQRLESKTGAQSPGLPRGPPHCAESHGYSQGPLVGAEQEARATAAVSSLASSSRSHPRTLPSLAGCLGGSGPELAGGRPGRRCRGGRKEGCPLWIWERRGEGAASGGAPPCTPPCRQPRELGTLAVRLACCHLALLGPSASPGGDRTPGGSELQGVWGAWWRGTEGKKASSGGREARQGSYMLNLGS